MGFRQEHRPADARPHGAGLAIAVAAAAAVSMLAACSAAPSSSQASLKPHTSGSGNVSGPQRSHPAWLLTRSALSQLIADPAARDELRASQIYEILQPGQQPLAGVTAEPLVTFASATALGDAISSGRLPTGPLASCTTLRPGPSRPWPSSGIPYSPPPRPRRWPMLMACV
jgi:hypothetical protein